MQKKLNMGTHSWLLERLSRYRAIDTEDRLSQTKIHSFVAETENCFSRNHTSGHITASAWIIDPERSSALLVHHRKLNRWLQPGGHIEDDSTVYIAARREVEEETGLRQFRNDDDEIFDVDIHRIPARKDERSHLHYDIRFLFIAEPSDSLCLSEESHDIKWFTFAEIRMLGEGRSIDRMIEKSA